MKALTSSLLLFGLILGLAPVPASAQGCGMGPGCGRCCGMGRDAGPGRGAGAALGALDLTPEQRTKADAVLERHRTNMDARFKDLDAARKTVRDTQADPAADAGRIKAAYARMADARAAVALERRAVDQEMGAILTPEQKKVWESRRGFQGPGRGRGGCRGGGWAGY